MIEREAFLRALAANEDDVTVRLAFADWLDEHGEHEEADRQRKWPAAKEWLMKFCRDHNPKPDSYSDARPIEFEELLEMGRAAVRRVLAKRHRDEQFTSIEQMLQMGWENLERARLIEPADKWEFWLSFGNNYEMWEGFGPNIGEYWKSWSILTGLPMPPGVEEKCRYGCSC